MSPKSSCFWSLTSSNKQNNNYNHDIEKRKKVKPKGEKTRPITTPASTQECRNINREHTHKTSIFIRSTSTTQWESGPTFSRAAGNQGARAIFQLIARCLTPPGIESSTAQQTVRISGWFFVFCCCFYAHLIFIHSFACFFYNLFFIRWLIRSFRRYRVGLQLMRWTKRHGRGEEGNSRLENGTSNEARCVYAWVTTNRWMDGWIRWPRTLRQQGWLKCNFGDRVVSSSQRGAWRLYKLSKIVLFSSFMLYLF